MKKIQTAFVFALLLLLSACGGVAFSPEAAAVQAFSRNTSSSLSVDQATVQVPLSAELSDSEAIVLLTYQGMRQGSGPETCVNTYQVIKRPFGWTPANGSGLCRQDLPGQDIQDLEISSGRYPGQKPQEPGYSLVYGLVNNPDIKKVRVTWDDNQTTEVESGSSAYITHRSGQFMLRMVEGLDDQDQVVFSHFTDLDPGARP